MREKRKRLAEIIGHERSQKWAREDPQKSLTFYAPADRPSPIFSLIQIRSVLDQIQGCRKVRSDFDEAFFLISSQRIRSMCFGCLRVRGCIKNLNPRIESSLSFQTRKRQGEREREPFREVRHCVEYFSPVERYASSFSASVKSFCLSMAYRRRRTKTHVVVVGVSRINIPNPITFPTLEPVLRHRKI